MFLLFIVGILAGMVVPFQTSVNSKLGAYTRSPIYASAISFAIGSLFLVIINIIVNPSIFTPSFYYTQSLSYTWFLGGIFGVIFLTGNLFLLPRLGASLTVVMTVSGQIIMGVVIDTFGWFDATEESFTLFKFLGILVLIFGIIFMNYTKRQIPMKSSQSNTSVWVFIGFILGFFPPVQTAINSKLATEVHSSVTAALISFLVGMILLFTLTAILKRNFHIQSYDNYNNKIKPIYFIGGILGVIFITVNIILMPHLGAALTTVVVMLGQMLAGVIIDHFGLLDLPVNKVTTRKIIGLLAILLGVILLRLF